MYERPHNVKWKMKHIYKTIHKNVLYLQKLCQCRTIVARYVIEQLSLGKKTEWH